MLSGTARRPLWVQSTMNSPFESFEFMHFAFGLGVVTVASTKIEMDVPTRTTAKIQSKHHHYLLYIFI